uniref:Type II secretion system F domain, type IV pilus assembly protein PilC n=1 Tax=uncultured Parcubacteria bacterium Rifle_16ft_4_minimus_23790 TaxID=1665136 RepID=A0A0H4TF22_9BACT|nr:type II secretion system F domain, type IV pilus assembly protein PilC [uncultured Parcubacteria bacterium Rifle_16ft_4_minimus_23790]
MSNKLVDRINKSLIRVPLPEKIMFTKHMSMMVKSGMSEIESIQLIRSQVKSRGFKIVLNDVIQGLENGQFLSATLSPYERVFGKLFINIISLGEVSGTLSENLGFLSSELKESQRLRSKVKSAMIYPAIILVATIGVVGALVLFILPRILPIFSSLGAELPLTTRILITTADFLQNYFFLVILGGVLLFIATLLLMRVNAIKYVFHRILLVTPFAGSISKKYNMANFTRTPV